MFNDPLLNSLEAQVAVNNQNLKAALAASPGDGPSVVLLGRVESLRDNPPPADWDGSWHLDQKSPATGQSEVGRP